MEIDWENIIMHLAVIVAVILVIYIISGGVSVVLGSTVYYETAKEGTCLVVATPAFLPKLYGQVIYDTSCPEILR